MGKHSQPKRSSVQVERGCPCWMQGAFQLFDYQQFYVRKALPEKKHAGESQAGGKELTSY